MPPGPRVFIPCQSHEPWGFWVGGGRGSLFFISLFHQHFAEMSPIDKWDKSKETLEIAVLCHVSMLNNPGESNLKHIYCCLGLNKYFTSNVYCFALISVLFLWKWNIAVICWFFKPHFGYFFKCLTCLRCLLCRELGLSVLNRYILRRGLAVLP